MSISIMALPLKIHSRYFVGQTHGEKEGCPNFNQKFFGIADVCVVSFTLFSFSPGNPKNCQKCDAHEKKFEPPTIHAFESTKNLWVWGLDIPTFLCMNTTCNSN